MGEKAATGMNIFAYLQDPANWFGPDNILNLLRLTFLRNEC